jgi:murein DD-endopeptidase MepM/ murein hydrolase activator NlpD
MSDHLHPYPSTQHAYGRDGHRQPRHGHDSRDAEVPRRRPPPPRPAASRAYTFGHGRHQVRIGPVAFWTAVGTLVIMAGWTLVTATYFAFHDDVLTRLIAREAAMQYAYEDRIADMRAQVDRLASRQLLDQEQFEKKLDLLIRKQAVLESRATTLGTLADPTAANAKSSSSDITGSVGRGAQLEGRSRIGAFFDRAFAQQRASGDMQSMLGRLQASLDRVENREMALVSGLDERLDGKARRIRAVLTSLGLDVGKGPRETNVGGPFVPVKAGAEGLSFEQRLQRVNVMRTQVERLNRTLNLVPVRKPVPGEIDLSSGFGVRTDPFVGRPAMHTGLDFRGDTGEPARATAAGTVTAAGWQGGYGKMVEVNHGNGLATRYGHLSEISVKVGQSIKIGQTVGLIGSTGRSTGPHLHYETRIGGEAVDPQRFLSAGSKLGLL